MDRKNTLYRKVIVPAGESGDGETPTCVFVTNEKNGHAIYFSSYECGERLIYYPPYYVSRDTIIDLAVALGHLPVEKLQALCVDFKEVEDAIK